MTTPKITTGGKEYIHPASQVLTESFADNPTVTYILSSFTDAQRLAYLPSYFSSLLTAAAMHDAQLTEIEGWKSCGVLLPPGAHLDSPLTMLRMPLKTAGVVWNIGWEGVRRTLIEVPAAAEAVKRKIFKTDQKYYYVFFFGTLNEARGKGLCSALVRHYQGVAREARLPIWLEAGTDYCMKIYARLGFAVVEEWVYGGGKAGADGRPEVGGCGVRIWGMVWWPDRLHE